MHINDIQNFDVIKSHILPNNMITLNRKQNRHPVVKIWRFQDFYIKLRLLINMYDITKKITIVHIYGPLAISVPTYDMYPLYSSWDFVFTSFYRQIHIKLRPLCNMHINDIQHFDIIKTYILANNMITLNMKQNRYPVVKIWRFQDFYIKPRLLINMHDITKKIKSAHLWTMGYQCTPIWHVSPV